MAKPFFYRINAADFLSAVVQVPEVDRGSWVLQLALDMVSADGNSASSCFAKQIIEEANEFSEKKRNAANKRWNAVHKQSNASNRSSNSNSKDKKTSCPKNKFSDDDMKCAEWIYSSLTDRVSKKPNLNAWANTVRLMVERDKRTHRQICELMEAANNHGFWRTNILCPDSLRRQFDKVKAQTGQDNQNAPQQTQRSTREF